MTMNETKHRFAVKTADLVLVGGLLVVATVLFLVLFFGSSRSAAAEVSVDGKVIMTLPLDTDTVVTIDGVNGGKNTLVIGYRRAWVTEASCPDKVCVRHHAVRKMGQTIICLPNKVVVRIVGGLPSVDAEAG